MELILKIAILHAGDLERLALGGVDQYIKTIIRNRGNNEIIVYGLCVRGTFNVGQTYHINKDGLQYTFIPISDNSISPLTIGYFIKEFMYLRSIVKADVIYSQRIELTIPFFFTSRNIRKKLFQVVHGSSFYTTLRWGKIKTFFYNFIEKVSISLSNETYVVLKHNDFGVPYYHRKYPLLKNKIFYTKIPINTSLYCKLDKTRCREELDLPQDKFIVMFGGRVENYPKRVFLFPSIVKELNKKNDDFFFVVVGDGKDLPELKKKFSVLNHHYFRIVGYIEDRNEFVKYLNASDCNLNISVFEGTCTASLESIACGVPVVSTDAGDINLFVDNGKNGFVIKNDTQVSLVADAVQSIIKIANNMYTTTNSYLNYESQLVVNNLLSDFKKNTSIE